MSRFSFVLLGLATALLLCMTTDALSRDDNDWMDDYRTQLRREIADRARRLRDARDGRITDRNWGTSNRDSRNRRNRDNRDGKQFDIFERDFGNPFGDPPKFDAPPDWLIGGSKRGGKKKQADDGPVDLSGKQLVGTIRPNRLPPPELPVMTDAEKKEAKDAAAEADAEAVSRAIKAAEQLFNNGEYGAARRMLLPIAASRRREQKEIDAAKQFIERVDTLAMKRLVEADEAVANKDLDAAAEAYDEIARKFGSAPAARLARHKLMVLKADPDVAADFLFKRANVYAEKNRLDVALPMLREIVRRYQGTPCAPKADALLKRLERMSAADGALTPDKVLAARKWLIIGDIHALNGRAVRAVDSYNRVIQDFEDSKYAEAAREKIAELRK